MIVNIDKYDCSIKDIVYKVTCKLCFQFYIGETYREAHDRFSEHRRAANSPSTYPDEALADHYNNFHSKSKADLSFEILETRLSGTVRRKIREAYYIYNLKPEINNKEECKLLERYLVK